MKMADYTTRTASLRATIADVRVLDAKKMNLDGKNILDYISDSEFDSYDTRDPQLKNDELDIWNTEISLSDNGHIEVKPLEHTADTVYSDQKTIMRNASKIINNEVLNENDEHLIYWQTDGLTDGHDMLYDSTLTVFSSDLSSLTNGERMFNNCIALTSFSSDLSSLMNGPEMFSACSSLTSFSSDLPSLTNGYNMFAYCPSLTSFSADLSSLTDGNGMFVDCTNLTSFTSDLSSLTHSDDMFYSCKLDAPSVANIVHTLPTQTDDVIYIGIGCDDTEADQLLFAQECDCETWQELLDEFSAKGWEVRFECNGRPAEAAIYGMRRGATLPIYAKLVEVTENEHYAYTSTDGSKFYNIYYFHSTNGSTEGYDVFSSLDEAISTYNVTPKN